MCMSQAVCRLEFCSNQGHISIPLFLFQLESTAIQREQREVLVQMLNMPYKFYVIKLNKQFQMIQSTYTHSHHPQEALITECQNNQRRRGGEWSYVCVQEVINQVIHLSWQQIKLNKMFSRCLQAYSNMKTMSNMQEVNTFIFNACPFPLESFKKQEDQPLPLTIDSLLPISADIDPENPFRKIDKKIAMEESFGRSRMAQRQESVKRKEKYAKLQVTEVSEEDGFTKQLRKLQQQRNLKAEVDKKAQQRKRQLQQQKLKQKKKNGQKEQKFSYDYNGELIEIKLQSKANLVSKIINGITNPNPKINKQALKDPNPIEVESTGKREKKLLMGKRKDEVEFSDVKSLADNMKATVGVKYTYQGKTYQQKQKAVSVMELRKTLSQRRISKEDYKRIRELNGNKKDYEDILKKSNAKEEERPQRAHSEAKRNQSRVTIRQKERIHVNNSDLKGKMLEKVTQQQEYLSQQQKQPETHTQDRLGSIDSFNLEYLRTGGTLHASTSKQFYSSRNSNNELPRITHTTLYSKMLPKGRERIKEANEIIRDLRKKFQDKLRV